MATASSITPFAAHALGVVRAVRGAFSELLTSVATNPQDPQSVSRELGLNKNLAWKICRIIQSDDPCVALEQMPGASGIKIFLRCMERAGASAHLLQTGREAIREYEQLIRVHSGDRATLEMMGSELSASGRQQRDEYHRKQLFQGASYVWGVQTAVMLKVGVVGPGGAPGRLDFASLSGLLGFRRLRGDVAWVVATRRASNDDGSEMSPPAPEAVDPRFAAADQAPLLADFCSQPLPELRRVVSPAGTSFELVEGPVGNTGARSCVVATIQRQVPYYRTPENEWGEHAAICNTPAELLIVDLFVHKTFAFAIPPEAILYSELNASVPYPGRGRERNRLPLNESLQDLGVGTLLLPTPEVRRYSQMVQTLFDRRGWIPTEFHVFRMKIAYPVCPSALVLRYRLPLPPESGGA